MNRSKRLFALALAAAAVLGATAAQAQSALDDVLKTKEIKIAIPTDFPPYGFVGTDLKPQGLDIEMANYIAAKLGVKAEPTPDGIIIDGGPIGGGEVWAHGDHRIAMSFSIASLRGTAPIRIHDCANVATSFPNFLALCEKAGVRVAREQ